MSEAGCAHSLLPVGLPHQQQPACCYPLAPAPYPTTTLTHPLHPPTHPPRAPRSQVFKELRSHMYGNPHSANPSSTLTSEKVEEVRDMVLR